MSPINRVSDRSETFVGGARIETLHRRSLTVADSVHVGNVRHTIHLKTLDEKQGRASTTGGRGWQWSSGGAGAPTSQLVPRGEKPLLPHDASHHGGEGLVGVEDRQGIVLGNHVAGDARLGGAHRGGRNLAGLVRGRGWKRKGKNKRRALRETLVRTVLRVVIRYRNHQYP